MYLIKKVSDISGVSVRTLHHYDEIGLLSPQKSENGYRYYSDEDLSILQTILFYKYLGFGLKEIKLLLNKKDESLLIHFKKQLKLMEQEHDRLLMLIDTLKKTIDSQEREITMSIEQKFKGFDYEFNKQYEQEAIEKYGRDVIEKSKLKQKNMEQKITDGFNKIFFAFAENLSLGKDHAAKENIELAKLLHEHLWKYSFDCTLDIFSAIGKGYVQDERFKDNIDKFGKGTAKYVCDAIQEYVSPLL